jgi:flagellar motor component MotA
MTKRYVLVVTLTLAVLVAASLLTGAGLAAFLDLPSLAVVMAPAVLMGFAAHSPREVWRSCRLALSDREGSREELEQAAAYFDGLARYLACGGAIGVMTGIVAILVSVKDVESAGRGFALCLLAALYAVLLVVLVAVPFRTAIRKRLAGLVGQT